jgi:hypothetical protein
VVLRNDSPVLSKQLAKQNLPNAPGKGLNIWLAFGWLAGNPSSGTILVHDCDIANYDLDLPLALALPVARLGYSFCKGYYSRVREELFGRVTRPLVIPLVRSLDFLQGRKARSLPPWRRMMVGLASGVERHCGEHGDTGRRIGVGRNVSAWRRVGVA